MKLLKGEV
ncbi:Protein of unknown function [Escherichia coli]|nr:Protein of unknown function [Escherichia coli]CDU40604.1 Protein of unknown function [Escherichia coli]